MPEVALSGRQRHKQRRQSNSRLVIQECHAMFMKSSDTKPIRYLSASGNNTETPFSGDSQIIKWFWIRHPPPQSFSYNFLLLSKCFFEIASLAKTQ